MGTLFQQVVVLDRLSMNGKVSPGPQPVPG